MSSGTKSLDVSLAVSSELNTKQYVSDEDTEDGKPSSPRGAVLHLFLPHPVQLPNLFLLWPPSFRSRNLIFNPRSEYPRLPHLRVFVTRPCLSSRLPPQSSVVPSSTGPTAPITPIYSPRRIPRLLETLRYNYPYSLLTISHDRRQSIGSIKSGADDTTPRPRILSLAAPAPVYKSRTPMMMLPPPSRAPSPSNSTPPTSESIHIRKEPTQRQPPSSVVTVIA